MTTPLNILEALRAFSEGLNAATTAFDQAKAEIEQSDSPTKRIAIAEASIGYVNEQCVLLTEFGSTISTALADLALRIEALERVEG